MLCSIDGLCVGTAAATAAAAVLWWLFCPWVIPGYLTGDQLIGRSPGGGLEKEGEKQRKLL